MKTTIKTTMETTKGPSIYLNIEGLLHRIDGPAIEYANGTKEWWVDGKRHREDGPAIEFADGSAVWFMNDKYMGLVVAETDAIDY